MKKLTEKSVHATQQVLTVNQDVVSLYECRGVPREDLIQALEIAKATIQIAPAMKKYLACKEPGICRTCRENLDAELRNFPPQHPIMALFGP